MHKLLEQDRASYAALLTKASAIAERHLDSQDSIPPSRFVADMELGEMPEHGIGGAGALDFFQNNFADKIIASAGPRYFGFVTGGSTPASIAGDWLVSAFDQNACGSNDSIAPQVEKQTIHFLKQLFGIDQEFFGSFVTGATMSNFVGLAQGRQWVGEQTGIDFSNEGLGAVPVKIISSTPHSSIIKSLSMLGIGRNSIVRPATLPDREAVDVGDLESLLQKVDAPVIVVANAGTVNTVDFDDLEAIGRLKSKYKFWLHVDAAFGGFAALSPNYQHLMTGINYADSITIDAHKWLNVPYDSAMQFTRHKKIQLQVFQNSAAYLGDPDQSPDYFHYTPENSRRWRALPTWFALVAYGREGHCEIVERNCALARELGEGLKKLEQFELLTPVRMNVVCFSLKGDNTTFEKIQHLLTKIRDDGKVFFTPTMYKGRPGVRAAISNWQTSVYDIQTALEVLDRIANQVLEGISTEVETR
jgi:glutamate/tyrosine decarboxylase-like PLP-dependent enzyme